MRLLLLVLLLLLLLLQLEVELVVLEVEVRRIGPELDNKLLLLELLLLILLLAVIVVFSVIGVEVELEVYVEALVRYGLFARRDPRETLRVVELEVGAAMDFVGVVWLKAAERLVEVARVGEVNE